ncbi:MAG: outer membrane beta-barrel protein [Bacteroidales bacterium]|nr:outer membrane beta-barrel protein [Bacteroidales bacterium]
MKRFLLLILVISSFGGLSAQQKWGITLGVGTVPQIQQWNNSNGFYYIKKEIKPHFSLGLNYRFSNNIEVALYGGYALLAGSVPNDIYHVLASGGSLNHYTHSNVIYYGTEVRYQLLPLFVGRPIRFDVYPLAKVGGIYEFWHFDGENYSNQFLEVGAGLGASFYFTKHFGIFGETLGGRFYNSWYSWRAGLSFMF